VFGVFELSYNGHSIVEGRVLLVFELFKSQFIGHSVVVWFLKFEILDLGLSSDFSESLTANFNHACQCLYPASKQDLPQVPGG
jgi:hypothetical protein